MERRFFGALVDSADDGRGRRQAGLLPVSFAIHTGVLAVAVVLPILGPSPLPAPSAAAGDLAVPAMLVSPAPPPRGRPPRAAIAPSRRTETPATTVPAPAFVVPTSWSELDGDDLGDGLTAGLAECEGCVPWGVDGVLSGAGSVGPPPPPEAPEPVVRTGGQIQAPVKLRGAPPRYPALAEQIGLEGLVIIECRVDRDGNVADARVLRGHPLLDEAALEAVRQWHYRPTLLNGTPVSVVMTVTMRFSLQRE